MSQCHNQRHCRPSTPGWRWDVPPKCWMGTGREYQKSQNALLLGAQDGWKISCQGRFCVDSCFFSIFFSWDSYISYILSHSKFRFPIASLHCESVIIQDRSAIWKEPCHCNDSFQKPVIKTLSHPRPNYTYKHTNGAFWIRSLYVPSGKLT